MEYNVLRKKYKNFIYKSYKIDETGDEIRISYEFEIEGLTKFNPSWTIKKPNKTYVSRGQEFIQTVFDLGMVELISYWKLTCSPNVYIEAGHLDDYQVAFFKKLYFYGLGEFFYINNIKTSMDDFMDLKSSNKKIEGSKEVKETYGNLIPVGGGKDSFVSLELLKDHFEDNHTYVINRVISALNASKAAGYSNKLINVTRSLDKRMLDLNKEGYLNGHTPFSALVAFSSILVAIVYKKKYICLSNESSANESTILDEEVNHQYSKSYDFEIDFNNYIKRYTSDKIRYFSFLRPLSELEITHIFSKLDKYHEVFRSCNVGSKEGIWCNHCAKCLFVYIMLAAFLDDTALIKIFNKNLLDDPGLENLFKMLSGLSANKPFECVGTRDEVKMAIRRAIKLRQANKLPYLLKKFDSSTHIEDIEDFTNLNKINLLPEKFIKILEEKLGDYR